MPTVGSLVDFLKERLTYGFAWLYHSPVESVDRISSWSGEHQIYWFSSKESPAFGQATPMGTIILNRNRLDETSYLAQRFIVEHEHGHRVRSPVMRILFYWFIIMACVGILGLVYSVSYGVRIPFGYPPMAIVPLLSGSLFLVASGIVAIRLEEIAADLHVLNHTTEKEYPDAIEELKEFRDDTLRARIERRVMYTSPAIILRIHRFRE